MSRAPAFSLLLACSVLAACSGERTFSASDQRMKIDGYYNDGVANRDIQLVILGDPFDTQTEAFRRTVEADLQTSAMIGRPPTRPRLNPDATAKPLYRLVYAFGQPNAVYGNTLCQTPESAARPVAPSHVVKATAAFCVGGRAETYVSGQTEADGPGDVRFYRLVRQMMDDVFRPDVRQEASPPPTRNQP